MLEVRGLTRRFGELTAVDDVTFEVPRGAMVGFVGGNGAGKTTTMRMIMGVLPPSAGEVSWQGRPATQADRARFGYMPEERGLYPKQPVLGQLIYLGRLHGMSRESARARAQELLERFGLGDRSGDRVEALSLGNQQRAQIIAAVLGHPQALILDEPFSGLDPTAVDQMAALLREHTAAGVPVLFSSHQLELVDRLCDKLVILHHGRVVADGTVEGLRRGAPLRYRIVLDGDASWIDAARGIGVVESGPTSAVVEPVDDEAIQQLLRDALARGPVRELSRVVPSLSEIYREVAAV